MKVNIQVGIAQLAVSGLLILSGCCNKPCVASHQNNICGTSYGRRLYVELGDHGVLTAVNVSLSSSSSAHRFHQTAYTGNLTSHEHCSLELVTCPACIIVVTFHHLDLPYHCNGGNMLIDSPCHCDYVRLSEPPYEDISGVPFCGLLASSSSVGNSPLKYQSQARSLAITLLYSEMHKHAFTLEYTAERNRHIISGSPEVSSVVSPSRNVSHSGILKSPFFPAQYPRDLGIEYVVSCNTDSISNNSCRVRIVFRDFQLASVSIMEFYDWNGHRLDVSSGAQFRPPAILTTGPTMLVRFYANGGTGLGFKAVYSFISENFQDNAVIPITDCGGYVENLGGAITMMNMVEHGVKAYDCIWLIRPPKHYLHLRTNLYLKVATFMDMAGSTELQILQGLTSEQPILDTLRHPVFHALSSRHGEYIVPVNVGFYVSLRGTFGPLSRLAIVYTAFNYMDCFSGSDFLCQNHRCIPARLNCDGFDHCGDNSDEPSTCYKDWELEPHDRRWYSHTPNYYFPKMDQYPDLKTATLIFVGSSLEVNSIISSTVFTGLIFLICALIVILYRTGTRARQQREIQDHLQTISELLDGARMDETPPPDDPPVYEAPPNYDEVIQVFLEPIGSQRQKKKKRLSRHGSSVRRSRSTPNDIIQNADMTEEFERNYHHSASALLEVALPSPTICSAVSTLCRLSQPCSSIMSRSCQTTPIPDSPPPPYTDDTCLERPGPSSQNQLFSSSTSSEMRRSKKFTNHGRTLRQSWILFHQESTEDQLLSVVVTDIENSSSFGETDETFHSPALVPSHNILTPISENTLFCGNTFASMGGDDANKWDQSEDALPSFVADIVPADCRERDLIVSLPPPLDLVVVPPTEREHMEIQECTSQGTASDLLYNGTILQINQVSSPLISFDDLIAERISQTFPQRKESELAKNLNTFTNRRCSSFNAICKHVNVPLPSESDLFNDKSEHSEHKYGQHSQIKDSFNMSIDINDKEEHDLTPNSMLDMGVKFNDSGLQTVIPICNCEGACGCATVGNTNSKLKPSRRKRHHIRSLSAGFSGSPGLPRCTDLRDLDIYFSLHHEIGVEPVNKPPVQASPQDDDNIRDPLDVDQCWTSPNIVYKKHAIED